MFKRVRWVTTGAALGVGGSLWLQRKLRDASQRYGPVGMAEAAVARARDALEEGRSAMREREEELRGRSGASRGRPPDRRRARRS